MKKWQKKVAIVLMSIGFGLCTLNTPIAHAEFNPPEEIVPMEHYFWGGYRKEDVNIYEEWGAFHQISDMVTGPGATITATRTISETTSVSESFDFITTILRSNTVSSATGYSMTVSNHGTYYLGYRVRFQVEEGYRVKDTVFGESYREYYKIKVPLYGHYQLIRAW